MAETKADQIIGDVTEQLTVIKAVQAYIQESREAKKPRLQQNRINREAYNGDQDWSHKIPGQSKEFIPKTTETAEQFTAFIKRGLTQFGDWFSVKTDGTPFKPGSIKELINCYLESLENGNKKETFATRLSDATKTALLESEMIFKVYGYHGKQRIFNIERGKPVFKDGPTPWKLAIDIIPFEDYFPDPSGNNLYEIHRCEKDLHKIQAMAEGDNPVYNPTVVAMIEQDYEREEEERRKNPNQADGQKPAFRKKVVLDEFLGTILKEDGSVWKENVLLTIANDKYLIRKPEPNPWWHQESHFVRIPLRRVPFSTWHKALYDEVVPLNFALNEMFNLMLDGGLASVWGVKQLRSDYLDDPRQIANGISQGQTLTVREDMPEGMKVLEQVTEGQIPQDAMQMYGVLDRELNAAALTNDIKLGNLPQRQVKATEIMEASQASNAILDSLLYDMDHDLAGLIRKAFLVILQGADDLSVDELKDHLTTKEMFLLARMTPEERYNMLAKGCKIKVFGLSSTLNRAREFQRMLAALQIIQTNPLLMPVFIRKFSGDKMLDSLFRMLNIDTRQFEVDENDEQAKQQDMPMINRMLEANQGNQTSFQVKGEPGISSDVNQTANPTDGV